MTATLEAPDVVAAPVPDAPQDKEAHVPVPMSPAPETAQSDYLRAAYWGIASALAAVAVSVLLLPVHDLPVVFLLGAGLGVLGYLDWLTHIIRDQHTALFGTAAVILLVATQVSQGGFTLGWSLICGAAAFVFMIVLGLTAGSMGGGDMKLAPVPAALLAAVSPLAALLWLQFTLIICAAGAITARLGGRKNTHLAMVPYMAFAVLPALAMYGIVAPILGL